MRIGVDLACWTNHRGYGRYTRNLLQALVAPDRRHTWLGFADAATAARCAFPSRLQLVSVPQSEPPVRAAAAHGRRKLADLWQMSRAVQRAGVDLMFFPSLYTYFPVLDRIPIVVVVHDAIPERWPALVFPTRAGRFAWATKSRLACWQARRVIAPSHASARAIRHFLRVPARRLRVVHEAADPVFRALDGEADRQRRRQVLGRFGIPEDTRLLLYVGGFGPHKNLATLLAAFARLRGTPLGSAAGNLTVGDPPSLHLVLVGETTGEVFYSSHATLREHVRRLDLGRHVTFTGYVSDADLVDLYHAAMCLVLPSLDEGFGLPAVEAMACGTPVVASRAGALPEVVGDAGLLVPPDRPEDWSIALRRLVSQPELGADLRERGLRRAAQFSWERAATELLGLFDELAPAAHDLDWRRLRRRAGHA